MRGIKGRKLLESGDLDSGIYWAGQVQGLIQDIPSVRDLVSRIVEDARRLIKEGLNAAIAERTH